MSSLLIGLTGGIGSGKTTIANLFAKLGVEVIDADQISRDLLNNDLSLRSELHARFGDQILTESGDLDRRKLREIVFNNENEKKYLEDQLHPRIKEEIKRQASLATSPYALIVVPLMFETHFDELVSFVICVDLDVEQQVKRTCLRDHIDEELARKIISAQMDRYERKRRSQEVIYNAGSLAKKKAKILKLHQKFLDLVNHE